MTPILAPEVVHDRLRRVDARLDAHSESLDKVVTATERLDIVIGHLDRQLVDHEQRIREMEAQGGRRWNSITLAASASVIGAIIALISDKIF